MKYRTQKQEKNRGIIGRKNKPGQDGETDDDDTCKLSLSKTSVTCSCCIKVSQLNSREVQLRRTLLENYVPEARPVINTATVTIVDVDITVIQVMDLVNDLHECLFFVYSINRVLFCHSRMNKIKS